MRNNPLEFRFKYSDYEAKLERQNNQKNKMEKLTLEMCLKYPNAGIQRYEKEMPLKKCSDFGNVLDYINFHLDAANLWETVSDCKLILRTIDSLTEEEKGKHDMIDRRYSLRPLASNTIETELKYCVEKVDYLRSINIDIDNLIEKGIAIEQP